MRSLRRLLLPLLVFALAATGAVGGAARAPRELRVSTDAIAEVAATRAAVVRARPAASRPALPLRPLAARRFTTPVVAEPPAPALTTSAWPRAHTGQAVLAFKRSRLI
jgi:hypothetical protein